MNVFLFLGCSFTWGEGLQYYSGLPSVVFHEKHTFSPSEITYPQYQFIRKNRFAALVANKVNGIDIVQANNGGNNVDNIYYLIEKTKKNVLNSDILRLDKETAFKKEELTHIVIQFTEIYRDKFESMGAEKDWSRQQQYDYCVERGISALDFEKDGIRYILRKYLQQLQPYIEIGVKVGFLMWHHVGWYDVICEDEFSYIKENLIKIKDKKIEYISIWDFTDNGNRYSIQSDFLHKGLQRGDSHLSFEGHKIIAESIYTKFFSNIYT